MGMRIGWSSLIRETTFGPGISVAVTTATLLQSNAGSRSIARSRACGSVERTVAPNHAPGKTRSSAYLARPVSFSGPSRRSGKADRARPGAGVPGGTITGDSTTGIAGAIEGGATRVVIRASLLLFGR